MYCTPSMNKTNDYHLSHNFHNCQQMFSSHVASCRVAHCPTPTPWRMPSTLHGACVESSEALLFNEFRDGKPNQILKSLPWQLRLLTPTPCCVPLFLLQPPCWIALWSCPMELSLLTIRARVLRI